MQDAYAIVAEAANQIANRYFIRPPIGWLKLVAGAYLFTNTTEDWYLALPQGFARAGLNCISQSSCVLVAGTRCTGKQRLRGGAVTSIRISRLGWRPTAPQVPVYGVGGSDQLIPMPIEALRRRLSCRFILNTGNGAALPQ